METTKKENKNWTIIYDNMDSSIPNEELKIVEKLTMAQALRTAKNMMKEYSHVLIVNNELKRKP